MTALSQASPRSDAAARSAAKSPVRATTLLLAGLGVQIALLLPSLVAAGIDVRLLNGVSVWDKPLKFEIALMVNFVTLLALMRALLPAGPASRRMRIAALVVTLTSTYEIAYIVLQAARGLASHFNNATPLASVAYGFMGAGAVALVAGCFAFGLEFSARPAPLVSEGLRLGAILGLCLGAALTLVVASLMSSGQISVGHWVGGELSDARGLPIVGWSTTGGDLRVSHFFATHLMQALPILGLAMDRMAPRGARPVVIAGAGLGVAIIAATFVQALMGHPLFG